MSKTVQLNVPVFLFSAVCVYGIAVLAQNCGNWVTAHKSPFACDDYSIRNPLEKPTVSTPMLFMGSAGLSVAVIAISEFITDRNSKADTIFKYRNFKLPSLLVHIFAFESYFALGYAMNIFVIQVTKYSVGRLRPHFYTVCQPADISCVSPRQLIYDYNCTGDAKLVDEGRLSFFSGHSCLSMYTATFLIIYLQSRIGHIASRCILSVVQTVLFATGLFASFSRISDYFHHPSDVAVGIMVGILGATYICNTWVDFGRKQKNYSPVHGKVKEDDESEKNPSGVKVDEISFTNQNITSEQLSRRLPPFYSI